jgi:hypothetical protein
MGKGNLVIIACTSTDRQQTEVRGQYNAIVYMLIVQIDLAETITTDVTRAIGLQLYQNVAALQGIDTPIDRLLA